MNRMTTFLSERLERKSADALLVTNLVNVRYLTGFDGTFGWVVLLGDGRRVLITDARYQGYVEKVVMKGIEVMDLVNKPFENLKKIVAEEKIKNLGFEGNTMTYGKLDQFKKNVDLKWVQIDDLVETVRQQKTAREIDLITKSQSLAKEIFETVKAEIEDGMSEKDIAWRIELLAREKRCDGLSFPPIVAINEHSACPHHHNTERKFRNGDLLLIDMGVIWKGYCSDLTRMIFTGGMNAKQKEIYEVVEKAQKAAIDGLRVGMNVVAADHLARRIISAAGYGEQFCHSLGHGVGLEIHEGPNLSPRGKGSVKSGTALTVEPGIYLSGEFGVRIEDLVIVEEDCVKVL